MVSYKYQIISLRKQGKSYSEIVDYLNNKVSKSTVSYWARKVILSNSQMRILKTKIEKNLEKARMARQKSFEKKRKIYFEKIYYEAMPFKKLLTSPSVAKVVLAVLYLTEGSKTRRGSVMFGNSDPDIIGLFLKLLRRCFVIDETKFRCTIQCRADQDIKYLEKFWSKVTKIPPKQFYKARVDARSIGQKSRKIDYKGVCRVDYFSARTYNELKVIGRVLIK